MISDKLKQAITDSGISLYRISKETGITGPVLVRFMSDDPNSHRDIRLEKTVDKLAEFLGMDLTKKPQAKAKPISRKK